jgi:hypothetical protein
MAILSYQELAKHPSAFLAFTGLTIEEFRHVLMPFGSTWTKTYPPDELRRGHPPIIKSMQDRLLFILHYHKCYPIQEVIGYLFGISQERASVLVKQCTDILCIVLQDTGFAPARLPEALKKKLKQLHARILESMEQKDQSSGQRIRTG